MLLGAGRPFWPLFLHILGAMTLFGTVLTAVIVSAVGWRRPELAFLRRATLVALGAAIPAYVVFRVAAEWIYSKEGFSGHDDPSWIAIGYIVSDAGLLLLLLTIGCSYWWLRSAKALPGRIVTSLSSVYLVMLAVAWLAMSGKWK
jgi:hypothetical protein